MIARRCLFAPSAARAVLVVLTLLSSGGFDGSATERWSRQVSNSEWIPLANPRTASAVSQLSQGNAASGGNLLAANLPNPVDSLALPPVLQRQYQEQLIQLQKTQENIQKLLLLQQQLRAQQQLLQSQTLSPSGFSNEENEKQALPPSSLDNLRTPPELLEPEALIPPQPSSDALPPVYPPQNFLQQRPEQAPHHHHPNIPHGNQELPGQDQVVLQQHEQNGEIAEDAYVTKQQGGQRLPDGKRPKSQSGSLHAPPIEGGEEEEVQLVYVPAETLAQRGQLKRGRGRKQHPGRQQHQENIEQLSLSPEQEMFARQVLHQIQKEHAEKAQLLKEERVKEFVRLSEEQKILERKARLQQEALQREQELLRQKEAEKKRKELERLEEMAKQRELERIREEREKQRQEELERRRLAELRAKEEKRREEEAAARQHEERRQKIEQQKLLENSQQEDQLRAGSPVARRPAHLADGNRPKKVRGRQRQRVNQYNPELQQPPSFREYTTTPSPNQPPLSVYMGGPTSRMDSVKVTDVLRILRDAKTIAVLDNVGPDAPQVFVGPSNLDPPYGYAKFDLPYLSSIDHNRVERKVDKLPFFVAPLSFDPPPGYSKIPFPAPHIGSVVVNTLPDSSSPEPVQNPSPTPLIQPNSYSDADQSGSIAATTASYDSPNTPTSNFAPEQSGNPKYESAYPAPSPGSGPGSGSRFRFRQFYDNKPTSLVSTSYYGEHSTKKPKPYEQSPKHDATDYRQEVSSTPSFQEKAVSSSSQDPSTRMQDLAAQLALINQELAHQRESQRYNGEQSQVNLGEPYDANDVRAPVGPTQYNLPAELPPISPHLPGLINSLVDKQEKGNHPGSPTSPLTTTTTAPTTTTATTVRVSSTTYRPRGRNRVVPTRARTTQASGKTTERTRSTRPVYNRSKSRFTTTTEEYRETYEPTKARTPETTQKYNTVETQRRPTSRTQKYRTRDRANSPAAVQNQNVQAHQTSTFENYPMQSDSQGGGSPADAYSPASGLAISDQKETSAAGVSDYARENYPPTQTENYPREVTVQHGASLASDDYASGQNYPAQNRQEAHYQQSGAATYEQSGGFQQTGGLEKAPVNGFNYQVANSPDQTIPQRGGGGGGGGDAKEYSRYNHEKQPPEDNYHLASTEDPRIRAGEEHRYSPIYEVNVAQAQPDYNTGGQNPSFHNDGKTGNEGAIEADPNAAPIFVPLPQSKQEEYELQIPSTEQSLIEIATTSTTTPASVIIRQRVRGRLGGSRPHHDSAIQTRPRGSQDEYVRFSAVNHDRVTHRNRDRTRTRARPSQAGSQVQTEGNEYIKIHAAQQRLAATTPPPPPPTTTTTTTSVPDEDVDYGFIRPPSFNPVHSVQPVHPVENRFQDPITYRPILSEIQHVIPNDETAVESSPSHILKNRPKYQQTPARRPTTKVFATTTTSTTTTTEAVPVATVIPDTTVYAARPNIRTDEQKRLRGRTRRPAKKRITTTSTTESGLDANNELPLDENYPRITPQLAVTGQQPLYDDNFEVAPQFVPHQNRQSQSFYEENSENYPQEFLLNLGNLPEQVSQREEYDQTQLASVSSKKYSHSSRESTGDIYGAESQWSTKLSKTSFQPSVAANRIADGPKRSHGRNESAQENAPEIITARPEASSVTVVISSDYQKRVNTGDVSAILDTIDFGRKTNAQDHTEKPNGTTPVTGPPTTALRGRVQVDKESLGTQDWTSYRDESSAEQTDARKAVDPLSRKTRRRRVRVRVRPAPTDDFVTAESQHFNAAVNSLSQDEYKYNPIRESKPTTAEPIMTRVTATATEATRKSLLQDFLEEMLKNDKVSIPTRVTFTTTELNDWTISTPMTTPYADEGFTTLKENNNAPIGTTLPPNVVTERITTTESSGSEGESREAISSERSEDAQRETKSEETKSGEYLWDKTSQEDKSERNNLENVELSENYNLPSSYPDGSGTPKEIEDTIAEMTGLPEIRKLSAVQKEKEHIMTLRRNQEANVEENEAHPKNHRAEWSEVRYPSAFDKSKPYSTTPISGVVTRNEGSASVKTLSDYVKAIFDTMKSAENQEEEIAKVVETTKNETTADNDVASIHRTDEETPEETDRETGATEPTQNASATERVEENATSAGEARSVTEKATTKESVTRLETITQIPDTTVLLEETVTTQEPPATVAPTTRATAPSIKQTAGGVARANSTETMLGKVLKTSTTTRVSHMTEICYRGRCVMTRPKTEDVMRR